MINPQEELQDQKITEFLDAFEWLARFTEPEGQYFYNGLSQWLKQAPTDKKPIEFFWGVDFPGKQWGKGKGFTQLQETRRNRLIKASAQLLQKSDDSALYKACGTLSGVMRGFRNNGALKNIRSGSRKVKGDLEQLLFEIFELDNNAPTSQRQLYKICKSI